MSFGTMSVLMSIPIQNKNQRYTSFQTIRDVSFTLTRITQAPSNTDNGKYCSFIDSTNNIMYCVGYNKSFAIKSENDGLNWNTMTPSTTSNTGAVVSDASAIILGSNGTLYNLAKSFDGGNTWTKSYLGRLPFKEAPGASFSFATDGMLMSQNRFFSPSNGHGFAFATPYDVAPRIALADPTSTTLHVPNVPYNSFNSCGNNDLSRIYVGSNVGKIHIVTINWGIDISNTVISCDAGKLLNSLSTEAVRGLSCSSDGSIVYACLQQGKIYKSTDSGLTFTILTNSPEIPSNDTIKIWRSLSCSSDGSVIIVCRYNEKNYISGDGGISWVSNSLVKTWGTVSLHKNGSKFMSCTETEAYFGNISYL